MKSVKNCLRKKLGRTCLTFDELRTLLVEIEGTINNRPKTYLYADEEGISYPLTPSKLINGRQLVNSVNEHQYEISSTHSTFTRKARHHTRMLSQFARQWSKEYLLGLREYHQRLKNKNTQKAIGKDDVILVKEDGTTRCLWRLAKVVEPMPSKDGVIRAAKVRVLSNDKRVMELRKPIQNLIPLEAAPRND